MPNPPRSKASDFEPEVLSLFDQYVHGLIDRRGFLIGAAPSRDCWRGRRWRH
jgi:carboxymethylenebutenolidase